MTISTLGELTIDNYKNKRYETIKQLEERGIENPNVYRDTDGVMTIGVGFNISSENI